MTVNGVTNDSGTRLAVISLRHRVEQIAMRAVMDAFPNQSVIVDQDKIGNQLAFILVAYEGRATPSELLGLLRLARHIYRRTSDVLHGRSSMVNLPAVLLSEWHTVVMRVEALAQVDPPAVATRNSTA